MTILLFNMFYGFRGSFKPLRSYAFASDSLTGRSVGSIDHSLGNRFRESWTGGILIPFPSAFVIGCDIQKQDFENAGRAGGHRSYFLGEWKNGGWKSYYVVGLVFKEPLAWIIALLLSIPLVITRRLPGCCRQEALVLALPSAAVFLLVTWQSTISSHIRYVLPALPFLFIWTGQFGTVLDSGLKSLKWLTVVLCAWFLMSSAINAPHWISYFNELTGGPHGGHRVLDNSNIDWGQDLLYLKEWMDEHPEATGIRIAYFGCIDPQWMGLRYEVPAPYFSPPDARHSLSYLGPQPGWYAVSVNFVLGSTMTLPNGQGDFIYFGSPVYEYFSRFEPVARAGNSIWIYHLKTEEVAAARKQMGILNNGNDRVAK